MPQIEEVAETALVAGAISSPFLIHTFRPSVKAKAQEGCMVPKEWLGGYCLTFNKLKNFMILGIAGIIGYKIFKMIM